MNQLTLKNFNPNNELTGDCVLRAFTALLENELSYNEIKKEILKYGKTFDRAYTFDKFASEIGMVKVDNNPYNTNEVKTFNRAIEFAKQFKVGMICIANNHAVYVDYKNGLIDTWDSRSKRIRYFYIFKEDAELLGLKINGNTNSKFTSKVDLLSTWIEKSGKDYVIKSSK